jgi:hypothetical protein
VTDPSTAAVLRQIEVRRADIAARRRALHRAMAQRQMVPGDDPLELYPTRSDLVRVPMNLLAQTEQVEAGDKWSRWDWIKWGAPWLTLGVVLGAILDMVIRLRF